MQAASKVVSERPLTLLIPVLPLLLYAAMALFWVWSTIYLFTICALSPPISLLALCVIARYRLLPVCISVNACTEDPRYVWLLIPRLS